MASNLAERAEILAPIGLAPLLSTDELMAHYGISNWTVNDWRKKGCPIERLPGGRRRFDLRKVRAWLAAQDADAAQMSAERARQGVAARS